MLDTLIVKVRTICAPRASVTTRSNVYVPAVVGDPTRIVCPGLNDGLRCGPEANVVMPGGRLDPGARVHVYGGIPPPGVGSPTNPADPTMKSPSVRDGARLMSGN